ncbi:MAG TPA: glutamate formimidoyltransferase [Bryobacteraceae bacterium]|nr:glutamate formimidoyltransferase [Bryobacteraceae bacterium]
MARQLIECVPNFSEGRDEAKVRAIERSIRATGVLVLRTEMDPDHNRSVITFAGAPEAVFQAALRAIEQASELIDVSRHAGVHPRIGAADVVPFVPIEGMTLQDCAELAHRAGEEVWRLLGIPVYFYEAAALRPNRRNLEDIRRGNFEAARRQALEDPERAPDIGGPALHPTAGAVILGARKVLIAWNINLRTKDLTAAKAIARKIRASSGGLPCVKALGLPLESRGLTQVSMNLTDFEVTPPHIVFEAVATEAAAAGVDIEGAEVIGLIPAKALELAGVRLLRIADLDSSRVLEHRLDQELPPDELTQFLDRLSPPLSPAGGGSAAAAAGAMAAALGSKISRIARVADEFAEPMHWFAEAARRDPAAFENVLMARKGGRPEQIDAALTRAAEIPIEIAERAVALDSALEVLLHRAAERLRSDVTCARALASAARECALGTARANIAAIQDAALQAQLRTRLSAAGSNEQ